MDGEILTFITYEQHMVTVASYEDAIEVLEDLAEIAEELPPNSYPLLKLVS